MPVTFSSLTNNQQPVETGCPQYRIKLFGYFEFADYYAWQTALADMDESTDHIEIDCSAIEYMDSSALGLLLLLNRRFNQPPLIEFTHISQSVSKLLERSGMMAVLSTAKFVKQTG